MVFCYFFFFVFFFFKQKTAYEIMPSLVGSEMCIRDRPGVAGFEINISCPNVEQGGLYFGNDPRAAAAVTESVRKRTRLPVWVKLTPMVSDIGVIARAVEAAGADALCAINTFVGMSIDLNAYKPRLSFRTGGLSGPAIRPLAVHLAHQAARAVRIPVIGIGGVMSAEDALEFLVAGCTAVQVLSLIHISEPTRLGMISYAVF